MEAARALADLVEISPQIEAAAVLGSDGGALGSIGVADSAATALAQAGRKLLEAAAELRADGGRVTQLHAALGDNEVFAVEGTTGRAIVAVTSARSAPGLVFYDLKRCLAAVAEDDAPPEPHAEAEPRARRRFWRKGEGGDAA